jgi:hypothetical protein
MTLRHLPDSFTRSLGTHATQLAGTDTVNRSEHRWDERNQISNSVRHSADQNDTKALLGKWLLIPEISVHCQEHVEFAGCSTEQFRPQPKPETVST